MATVPVKDASASLTHWGDGVATAVAPLWTEVRFYDMTFRKFFSATYVYVVNMSANPIEISKDGVNVIFVMAGGDSFLDEANRVDRLFFRSAAGADTFDIQAKCNAGGMP